MRSAQRSFVEPQPGELWEVQPGVIGAGERLRIIRVEKHPLHRAAVIYEARAGEERRAALDDRWGDGIVKVEA